MARPKNPNSKANLLTLRKEIIVRLVDENVLASGMWPREMKFAKQILLETPNFQLWKNLSLDRKVFSLSFFLTPPGKALLNKEVLMLNFELPNREKIDILSKPVIEAPKPVAATKRTIKDFLNE